MVEAALAPLHIKGGSPCEYPHKTLKMKRKRKRKRKRTKGDKLQCAFCYN
jgi:hypothetical protein